MKKLNLLLASLGAAALFVGGTFAAYVITDNANPIGKKISPSEITDDQTGNITLEWGENTIANVGNLAAGATKKMGNIVLKASGEDGNAEIASYTGSLNLKLSDLTTYESEAPANKLIDLLDVYVVSGDVSLEQWNVMSTNEKGAILCAHITHGSKEYSLNASMVGTKAGSTYSVFVELSDSATPVYSAISAHVVYLQFDWNANSSDANIEETTKLYFKLPNAWLGASQVSIYAWKDALQNAAFPGVAMKDEGDGLYSYELAGSTSQGKDKFNKVIFSDDKGHQTVDTELDYSKVYFSVTGAADGEGKFPCASSATQPQEYNLAEFYLTGVIKGESKWYSDAGFLSDYAMSTEGLENDDHAQLKNVELKAGDELLIIGNDGATYYKTKEGTNWLVMEDGNYDIYLNGDYNIWLNKI